MSKSLNNHIGLFDTDEEIAKKLKGAFTDPQKLRRNDPGRPEVCNIYTLHTALTAPDLVPQIERDCRSGALGCGDCKKMLGQSLSDRLTPIRDRHAELSKSPDLVLSVLESGGKRCREIAAETMAEVRSRMGMRIEAP
jgi:tryptophanyl-tRNA synthetase